MEYKLNCRWHLNHFLGFESRKLNNYSMSGLASHLGLEMFDHALWNEGRVALQPLPWRIQLN